MTYTTSTTLFIWSYLVFLYIKNITFKGYLVKLLYFLNKLSCYFLKIKSVNTNNKLYIH